MKMTSQLLTIKLRLTKKQKKYIPKGWRKAEELFLAWPEMHQINAQMYNVCSDVSTQTAVNAVKGYRRIGNGKIKKDFQF